MSTDVKGELIAEGKTKKLFRVGGGQLVLMESTDSMTKGDGEIKVEIPGKGVTSTQTCINIFEFLERKKVATHFIDGWFEPNQMVVQECDMLKLEVVVRGVARGAFVKRNSWVSEGTELRNPVVELYYKDDLEHDPLIIYDGDLDQFLLYVASKPLETQEPKILGRSKTFSHDHDQWVIILLGQIETIALTVFVFLRDSFKKIGVDLHDIKIEFGFNAEHEILVADVLDADSMRLQYQGKELSKQVFRDAQEITPELIEQIKENYQLVEHLSEQLS